MKLRYIYIVIALWVLVKILVNVGETKKKLDELDRRTEAHRAEMEPFTRRINECATEASRREAEVIPLFNKLMQDAQTEGLERLRKERIGDRIRIEEGFHGAIQNMRSAASTSQETIELEPNPTAKQLSILGTQGYVACAVYEEQNLRILDLLFDPSIVAMEEFEKKLSELVAVRDEAMAKMQASQKGVAEIAASIPKK
jgi:hypothetical protein